MLGEHSTWGSGPGYRLLDRYARNLPGRRAPVDLLEPGGGAVVPRRARRSRSQLRRTDAEFWRILELRLPRGRAVQRAGRGRSPVRGGHQRGDARPLVRRPARARARSFEADGQRFRVVGVVPDVPASGTVAYGDVWVPLTTAKTDAYKNDIMGPFMGIALLGTRRVERPAVNAEFAVAAQAGRAADPKTYDKLIARFETPFENMAAVALRPARRGRGARRAALGGASSSSACCSCCCRP